MVVRIVDSKLLSSVCSQPSVGGGESHYKTHTHKRGVTCWDISETGKKKAWLSFDGDRLPGAYSVWEC